MSRRHCNTYKHNCNKNNHNIEDVVSDKKHTFMLTHVPIDVYNTEFKSILFFMWDHSEYKNFKNGKVMFNVEITDRNLDIRVIDKYKKEYATIGLHPSVTNSGCYSFSILNPSQDTLFEIQLKKSNYDGVDPRIFSIVLNYTS